MTGLISIVKLLVKDTYRGGDKNGGRVAVYALLAVVYLFFEFAIVSTLVQFAPYFRDEALIPEYLTAIMIFGLTAVSTLGIMPMLSLLYFSKDSEFFLSLPIQPSKVYFAKLITVYLTQLVITALILLPALFGVGISIGLNWPFYIVMIFAVLLLPIFPLMVISIICLPLMYIIRFFKNRGAAASVVAMVLFIAVFFGYMLIVRSTSDMPDADAELIGVLIGPVKNVSKIFVPFLAINRFATFTKIEGYSEAISLLLNFFIFVVPALLLFGATLVISRKAYSRAVSTQLENAKRGRDSSVVQGTMSTVKALMTREWKDIIRTPVFAMQCFAGLIIMPILLIIMGISGEFNMLFGEDAETIGASACIFWLIIVMMMQTIVVSTNIGAATSVSRDGKTFYISKLLPIPYETQIKAKIMLYNLIYDLDIVLCIIVQLIVFGFKAWWVGLLLLVYLLIVNYGFITLCILLDLSKPKLDWKSYREIVKNSRNAMLPTLIGILISFVINGAAIAIFIVLYDIISVRLAAILVLVLMIGGALAFAFIMRNMLRSNVKKYFERIEG
ncbi:MAG: hypothetical protein J1F36_04050 [Clostridiales bacterium]|nr:hypothetical protein [Clostridiales bacterium]